MRKEKIYLTNDKSCIEYYTLGQASLKRCMDEFSRLHKFKNMDEEKFNHYIDKYYDEKVKEVIERLNVFGNTTCSDATVKYFGGVDNMIRAMREKYNTYVWISLKGEDSIPIIEYLDTSMNKLGNKWSVKEGNAQ